jgi:hypothetical protein
MHDNAKIVLEYGVFHTFRNFNSVCNSQALLMAEKAENGEVTNEGLEKIVGAGLS